VELDNLVQMARLDLPGYKVQLVQQVLLAVSAILAFKDLKDYQGRMVQLDQLEA
jgi:hypothetical protein